MFTSAVSTIRCYLFRYSFSSNYLSLLVSFFFFAFLSPIPIPRDDLIPRPIVHTGFGRMGIDQKSRLEEGYDSKPRVQVLSPITIGFPFCVFILSSLLLAFFFHTCVCVCEVVHKQPYTHTHTLCTVRENWTGFALRSSCLVIPRFILG